MEETGYAVWNILCVTFSYAANNFKLRNYPQVKTLNPRKEILGLQKHPRKTKLSPRNTHEEKSWIHEIPTIKKFWTHEIPRTKYF